MYKFIATIPLLILHRYFKAFTSMNRSATQASWVSLMTPLCSYLFAGWMVLNQNLKTSNYQPDCCLWLYSSLISNNSVLWKYEKADNIWIFNCWEIHTVYLKMLFYYQYLFSHSCWKFIILKWNYPFSPVHSGISYAFPNYSLIPTYFIICAILL